MSPSPVPKHSPAVNLTQHSQLQSEQRGDPHYSAYRVQINRAWAKSPLIPSWLTEQDVNVNVVQVNVIVMAKNVNVLL